MAAIGNPPQQDLSALVHAALARRVDLPFGQGPPGPVGPPQQDPLALIHAALAARRVDPPVGQGPPGPFGPQPPHVPLYGHGNLDDYMPDGPQHGHLHDPRMANGIGADLGGGILSRIEAEHSDPLQQIKALLAQLGAGGGADPLAGLHSNPMEGEHDPLAAFHSHFLQPADRGNPGGLAHALRGSHHSYQEPRARRSMLAHAAGGHGQMRAY